jgi:hypothetical protein
MYQAPPVGPLGQVGREDIYHSEKADYEFENVVNNTRYQKDYKLFTIEANDAARQFMTKAKYARFCKSKDYEYRFTFCKPRALSCFIRTSNLEDVLTECDDRDMIVPYYAIMLGLKEDDIESYEEEYPSASFVLVKEWIKKVSPTITQKALTALRASETYDMIVMEPDRLITSKYDSRVIAGATGVRIEELSNHSSFKQYKEFFSSISRSVSISGMVKEYIFKTQGRQDVNHEILKYAINMSKILTMSGDFPSNNPSFKLYAEYVTTSGGDTGGAITIDNFLLLRYNMKTDKVLELVDSREIPKTKRDLIESMGSDAHLGSEDYVLTGRVIVRVLDYILSGGNASNILDKLIQLKNSTAPISDFSPMNRMPSTKGVVKEGDVDINALEEVGARDVHRNIEGKKVIYTVTIESLGVVKGASSKQSNNCFFSALVLLPKDHPFIIAFTKAHPETTAKGANKKVTEIRLRNIYNKLHNIRTVRNQLIARSTTDIDSVEKKANPQISLSNATSFLKGYGVCLYIMNERGETLNEPPNEFKDFVNLIYFSSHYFYLSHSTPETVHFDRGVRVRQEKDDKPVHGHNVNVEVIVPYDLETIFDRNNSINLIEAYSLSMGIFIKELKPIRNLKAKALYEPLKQDLEGYHLNLTPFPTTTFIRTEPSSAHLMEKMFVTIDKYLSELNLKSLMNRQDIYNIAFKVKFVAYNGTKFDFHPLFKHLATTGFRYNDKKPVVGARLTNFSFWGDFKRSNAFFRNTHDYNGEPRVEPPVLPVGQVLSKEAVDAFMLRQRLQQEAIQSLRSPEPGQPLLPPPPQQGLPGLPPPPPPPPIQQGLPPLPRQPRQPGLPPIEGLIPGKRNIGLTFEYSCWDPLNFVQGSLDKVAKAYKVALPSGTVAGKIPYSHKQVQAKRDQGLEVFVPFIEERYEKIRDYNNRDTDLLTGLIKKLFENCPDIMDHHTQPSMSYHHLKKSRGIRWYNIIEPSATSGLTYEMKTSQPDIPYSIQEYIDNMEHWDSIGGGEAGEAGEGGEGGDDEESFGDMIEGAPTAIDINIRKAIYAGRVSSSFLADRKLNRTTKYTANSYHQVDVTSEYPYVMAERPFPVGECREMNATKFCELVEMFGGRLMFIVHVQIDQKEVMKKYGTPYLPKRGEGEEPLNWIDPPDVMDVWVPTPSYFDLLNMNALKHLIPDSNDVVGYYWDAGYPFRNYIMEHLKVKLEEDVKKDAGQPFNPVRREASKLDINSVSGKVVQRNRDTNKVFVTTPSQLRKELDKLVKEGLDIEDVEVNPYGDNVFITVPSSHKIITKTPAQLGVFIYAYARSYMWNTLFKHEPVLYSDTDSGIISDRGVKRLGSLMGKRLGKFKVEEDVQDLSVLAPKMYQITGVDKLGGTTIKTKSKGIGMRDTFIDEDGVEKIFGDASKEFFNIVMKYGSHSSKGFSLRSDLKKDIWKHTTTEKTTKLSYPPPNLPKFKVVKSAFPEPPKGPKVLKSPKSPPKTPKVLPKVFVMPHL